MSCKSMEGRYVWIDGDVYQITRHLHKRSYHAKFHAGYDGDADENEPEVIISVTSYRGNERYWPFDGDTLTGERY